jgi:tRNA(Ile2) C34 agmatinyltransferase TiaS
MRGVGLLINYKFYLEQVGKTSLVMEERTTPLEVISSDSIENAVNEFALKSKMKVQNFDRLINSNGYRAYLIKKSRIIKKNKEYIYMITY